MQGVSPESRFARRLAEYQAFFGGKGKDGSEKGRELKEGLILKLPDGVRQDLSIRLMTYYSPHTTGFTYLAWVSSKVPRLFLKILPRPYPGPRGFS